MLQGPPRTARRPSRRTTGPTERRTAPSGRGAQHGAATVLVLAVVVLAVTLVAGAARLGSDVVAQQRAQVAADVVALAGAAHGEPAAARVAARNDSRIVRSAVGADGSFALTLRRGSAVAAAAAARG